MKIVLRILVLLTIVSSLFSQYPYDNPIGITYSNQLRSYLVTNQTPYGKYESCMSSVSDGTIVNLTPPSTSKINISMLLTPTGIVNINDTIFFTDACQVKKINGVYGDKFTDNPYTKQQDEIALRAICWDGNRNLYISLAHFQYY